MDAQDMLKMATEGSAEPIAVPFEALSSEALRGLIRSFVLREGTDYGERECSLEQKISQVMAQLERGDAQIVFDPPSETVNIISSKKPPSGVMPASGA